MSIPLTRNYTIIMAWYNVREKEQNPLKDIRHNNEFVIADDYIHQSRIFIEKEFPLIIFVEPKYVDTFWKIRPTHLHSITRVIAKDYEELYGYNALFSRFSQNFETNAVQNLHKEKFTPLYNFVVNQKVEFVREAIQWNPFNSEKFGWMDLRLYDMSIGEIDQIFEHFPEDRVIITQSWYTDPHEVTNRYNWFQLTRGRVCAGFFAGFKNSLLKFGELCRHELKNAIDIGSAPTDEMIYAVVVAENLNLFEPHMGDYPDVLHNIIYNRANAFYTVNYLHWAFKNNHFYYVHRICENLRKAYFHSTIGYSCLDLHNVWYYNLVACRKIDKHSYCCELLEEYLKILLENENQKQFFCNIWNDFKLIFVEGDHELLVKYENMIR